MTVGARLERSAPFPSFIHTNSSPHVLSAATLRDHRLRAHFGVRYDHRANLVDWDYQVVYTLVFHWLSPKD